MPPRARVDCLTIDRLLALFERAPNAVLVIDADGSLLSGNEAAGRTFGRDSLEARGARLQQLLDPDEMFEPRECAATDKLPTTRVIRFLDQAARPFEARVTIHDAGRTPGEVLALHFHDSVIGESIEDALFVLKEDLVSLNEALLERNADLERFASVAAHDLQEPLRKIAIFSDVVMTSHAHRLDEDGRRRLEIINNTARQMRALVEGLLLYARSSGRRLRVEDAPLGELMTEACDSVRTMIEDAKATVQADALPMARVDRGLFVHVLQNLLTNAIKFRGEDPPRIKVSADTGEGDIVLCVADNGRGFDMKHHDVIFQSFTRLHRRDEIAGEGIGLALCKRIVERHGGRIWAESEPGLGSRFYIRIARGREQSRAA